MLLDACVLAPFSLCDLLLRLAESPSLYSPKWSSQILEEVSRTQIQKLKWPEELANSWLQAVEAAFPEARVTNFENLISHCTNEEKGRHVLAAAIKSGASRIVTANERDFELQHVSHWNITAVHPQRFLCDLYAKEPTVVNMRLSQIGVRRGLSRAEVLTKLRATVPEFAILALGKEV